jgi:hypothetical protein
MLYSIHHPSGNVVIRTYNPLIVLQYQKRGWLAAASLDELLLEHAEWRPSLDRRSAWRNEVTELVSRVCGSILASFSPTIALVSSRTPSGTAATVSLLASLNQDAAQAASAAAGRTGAGHIGDARNGGSFWNASGSESEGAVHIQHRSSG